MLATYKSYIGNSSQYVLRSATSYNGNITDGFYPVTAQKSFSKDAHVNPFILPENASYVVGIQGQPDTTAPTTFGCTTYHCMDLIQANTLMEEVFNINNASYNAVSVATDMPEEVYKSLINPQQYILTCMYLPFDAEEVGGANLKDVVTGWYNMGFRTRVYMPSDDPLIVKEDTFNLPKHPQSSRGNFLNNSPYTSYTLSFMPFGEIEIPADMVISSTQIHYKLTVDIITGQGTLKVYAGNSSTGQLIAGRTAQIGVPIAVSGGLYDYRPSDAIQGIGNIFTQGTITKGVISAISETAKVGEAMISPSLSTNGSNGAIDFVNFDVILYASFNHVASDDITQHGRPLCEIRTINTLSGYVQCLMPDLDMPSTITEKDAIVSFMSNGFYYE